MKFRGFISIKPTLPRNKSRFYYKRTLQKFQMDFQFTPSLCSCKSSFFYPTLEINHFSINIIKNKNNKLKSVFSNNLKSGIVQFILFFFILFKFYYIQIYALFITSCKEIKRILKKKKCVSLHNTSYLESEPWTIFDSF